MIAIEPHIAFFAMPKIIDERNKFCAPQTSAAYILRSSSVSFGRKKSWRQFSNTPKKRKQPGISRHKVGVRPRNSASRPSYRTISLPTFHGELQILRGKSLAACHQPFYFSIMQMRKFALRLKATFYQFSRRQNMAARDCGHCAGETFL